MAATATSIPAGTGASAAVANFCSKCGSVLVLRDTGSIPCRGCKSHYNFQDMTGVVVTASSKQPKAAWLENLDGAVDVAKKRDRAFVEEECPKCGNSHEVTYYTMQLRSADEGATVFYECSCGHKWSTNN